jgi:hypothetical protein
LADKSLLMPAAFEGSRREYRSGATTGTITRLPALRQLAGALGLDQYFAEQGGARRVKHNRYRSGTGYAGDAGAALGGVGDHAAVSRRRGGRLAKPWPERYWVP